MRSATAEISRNSKHVRPVHACGVRRGKIMSNQNVRLSQGKKCLRSLSLEVANYPFCYVLNIQRALSQIGIIDLIQGLGVTRGDLLENPFYIVQIGLQFAEHFID